LAIWDTGTGSWRVPEGVYGLRVGEASTGGLTGGFTIATTSVDASVVKTNGSTNELTITVTEDYGNGETGVFTQTFTIANNSAGKYPVGAYEVYVDTKGNTQIRDVHIVR
jgi:hypothetical protein